MCEAIVSPIKRDDEHRVKVAASFVLLELTHHEQ